MNRLYWIKNAITEAELCSWDDAVTILNNLIDDIRKHDPELSYSEILDTVTDCYPIN